MLAELQTSDAEEAQPPSWWAAAACNDSRGSLTALFFSEELADIARAKAICTTCPVREPCLEGAVARREPWGVWGGQLFLNGKILPFKRKRGRPPKNRRPEDIEAELIHAELVRAGVIRPAPVPEVVERTA